MLCCEPSQEPNKAKDTLRQFIPEEHINNVLEGELVDLYDNHGNRLEGIKGRVGISAPSKTGFRIGIDYMEMSIGSSFPLHTHEGDHILYVIEGKGVASVNGKDHFLKEGDAIFVPSEYPHAFRALTIEEGNEPFKFVAVGNPHRPLTSKDRMKVVEEDHEVGSHQHEHENGH